MFRMRRLPRAALALALVPLAGLAVACGGSDAAASDAATDQFTLKVYDPGNSGAIAVGKRDGDFERALAPLGAKIEWVKTTPGFSSNLKLFNTGELDIQTGAYSPVVGALSKDVGVRIFATSDPYNKDQSGIIATPGSGIEKLEDLEGKRVAVNPAAKGEYIVLKALTAAHIPIDSVERVPLQQTDAASAFSTGQVDAWASFLAPYQEAKVKGAKEIATEGSIDSVDNTIIAGRTAVLQEHPEAVQKFLEVTQDLTRRQRENPAAFENVFEQAGPRALTGQRLDDAIALGGKVTDFRYPTAADEADLQSVADLFYDNGVIQRQIAASDLTFDLQGAVADKQAARR
ncbi:sulfonate transport system substrate-binding protein [Rhodococcus sp. AG1013]|uniref:NrtA/SsuA/CpmA family ABC transporter substrate-binding protein n=1 Tax=Rhodococcus sp. AG1013 TaxID=2183996 RepID=UPI000E0CB0CA|nr:NrtA/SsuA/CpmA family ABC transporter substrate-binding protein [Rhodococcus sp. AG1013]RDI15695.1 sulfonate transport system substrate-binding protein [Rhodococcus sp. AG1013]